MAIERYSSRREALGPVLTARLAGRFALSPHRRILPCADPIGEMKQESARCWLGWCLEHSAVILAVS
jgi:hypothetical protein